MLTQTRWRVAKDFEAWNPAQKTSINYCGLPGGYCSTYYNQEPNITQLYGPMIDEVPEAYGTIPGVYGPVGVSGGANFAVATLHSPLGDETATVVPGTYGRRPGVYDRAQHLEILDGALGLAPATKALLRFGAALAVGTAIGVAGTYAVRRIKGF